MTYDWSGTREKRNRWIKLGTLVFLILALGLANFYA